MFLLLSFRYVLCFMLGDYVGFCISFGSLFYDFRLGFCLHCRLRHYIFFFVTSSVPVEECSRFSDRRSLLRFPLRNGASIPFALTFYLIFRNLKHVGFHLYICYMKLLRRAFQIAVSEDHGTEGNKSNLPQKKKLLWSSYLTCLRAVKIFGHRLKHSISYLLILKEFCFIFSDNHWLWPPKLCDIYI